MEKVIIISFLLLNTTLVCAQKASEMGQEFCFPICFEDAVGNKDTVYIGDSPDATFRIDEHLGETNLLGKPVNDEFDVFLTDAASGNIYGAVTAIFDCYLETDQVPTFVTSKQWIDNNKLFNWYELGMIVKNWPVTIRWNQKDVNDFAKLLGILKSTLNMYSWNPPVSLMGDVYYCGDWPNYYTFMDETNEIKVSKDYFCHYFAPSISSDSINLFYIKFKNLTDVEQLFENNPTCSYSSESQSIKIANTNNLSLKSVKIFDATGKLWISESMEQERCTETELDASMLSKGFYLVVVQPYDENFPNKTFKIQIK